MDIKDFDWSVDSYKDLSLEDLSKVIYRYRKRLVDLIILYNYKKLERELEYTEPSTHISTEVKSIATNIINQLGYTQNTLYRKEAELISHKLVESFKWSEPHGPYSAELLAICIVSTILEYYNANVDDDIKTILKNYDVNINDYIKLSKACSDWCNKNYWRKR
jgi:hypothetical protein